VAVVAFPGVFCSLEVNFGEVVVIGTVDRGLKLPSDDRFLDKKILGFATVRSSAATEEHIDESPVLSPDMAAHVGEKLPSITFPRQSAASGSALSNTSVPFEEDVVSSSS
jgi:hypothetical protein